MLALIYLTVTHETEEMLKEMTANNEEIAMAIYAGIKFPMSVGDSYAVEKQLLDIREKVKNVEVFICDTNKAVIFSSREGTIKSSIGRYISNKNALRALTLTLESGEHPEKIFEEQVSINRYLIYIHAIFNQPECFKCHGSEKKVLGAIVLRKSTDRNYAAITGLRNTNIIITVFSIGAIIAISHALLARLVSRPVKDLAEDIRELPGKISSGEPLRVPEIKRTDEIGELQHSFSKMAFELDEKTRAIEKSSAELAKANKELEAFAYSVSHDLRAPLRNIDGFSKILLDEYSEKLDEQAEHYLKRVRTGTERMSLLIDDMLTFSRIGRAELQVRRTNCIDIIKNILEYYSGEIDERKIKISVGELPVIKCDSTLMQSLFSNLLSNALKFTRDTEKPEISIGYDKQKEAIFVRDNGIGFDMQYHDKIFQVFQRLHLPEEYHGTGIGLAIVKRVAERHKGTVWAESKPGEGTTFFIKLPTYKGV
ncbi:MAG: ATP-binding protein [Nitrospirota bacterium]